MRPRASMRLSLVLALAALAGCGPGRQAGARHAEERPQVMSLNPCIDAIVLRVADPGQIVSISHYSQDARATSVPLDLARRFRANDGTAEEVVAARPDLILLGPHVAPATQAAIRSVGVHMLSIGVPASIAQSRAQIMAIARAVGHPARGRALVAQIDAALARTRPPAGSEPISALIREGGGLVPGTGTLADELLTHTGFANRSARYHLAMWDILPLEPLIADPPRVLLTDPGERESQAQLLAKVPGLRIADFPARLLRCAGPGMIAAAQRLAAIRRDVVAP